MGDKPCRPLLQGLGIGRLKGIEEGSSILASSIQNPVFGELAIDEVARHHQEECTLYEPPSYEELRCVQWCGWVQTLWSPNVGGVYEQIVKPQQALKVEGARVRGPQKHDRADAGL
jgi:hypothetical protein